MNGPLTVDGSLGVTGSVDIYDTVYVGGTAVFNNTVTFKTGTTSANAVIFETPLFNSYNLLSLIPMVFALQDSGTRHLYFPVLGWTGQGVYVNRTLSDWGNQVGATVTDLLLAPGVQLKLFTAINGGGVPHTLNNSTKYWSELISITFPGPFLSYSLYLV